MKKQILSISLLLALTIIISGCLGSMGGMNPLAGEDNTSGGGGDIEQQSEILLDTLRAGSKSMLLAYSNMQLAAGHKIEAEKYAQAAELINGDTSPDEIGKTLETIKDAQADAEAKKQSFLNTREAKISLRKSTLFFTYAVGYDTAFTNLASKFIQDASSEISKNPMLASKLKSSLDVVELAADTLPGQISNAGGTLTNLVEYAKDHDIPETTPAEKEAVEEDFGEEFSDAQIDVSSLSS